LQFSPRWRYAIAADAELAFRQLSSCHAAVFFAAVIMAIIPRASLPAPLPPFSLILLPR
jgi:hypothetical protein